MLQLQPDKDGLQTHLGRRHSSHAHLNFGRTMICSNYS